MGVFSKSQGPSNDVKRNGFDGKFENHLTSNFGQLTPVFCKEVMSGDTFEIDSAFGLNFMPTVFPVQSKINSSLHFFYVRGKNLWKDYYDWYFGTREGLQPPYIDPKNFTGKPLTGSIYDYMGLPTTHVGFDGGNNINLLDYDSDPFIGLPFSNFRLPLGLNVSRDNTNYYYPQFWPFASSLGNLKFFLESEFFSCYYENNSQCVTVNSEFTDIIPRGYAFGDNTPFKCNEYGDSVVFVFPLKSDYYYDGNGSEQTFQIRVPKHPYFSNNDDFVASCCLAHYYGKYPTPEGLSSYDIVDDGTSYLINYSGALANRDFSCVLYIAFTSMSKSFSGTNNDLIWSSISGLNSISVTRSESVIPVMSTKDIGNDEDNVFSSGAVKINALPFRAYESIYNAFYRDARNNPFIVDGEPEYNKFITSDDGGVDSFDYQIHYRNWENDFLTTAQPTPQFGVAPLVGISSSGKMSYVASEDGKTYNVQADVSDDGSIASVSYSENLPASVRRSLVDTVSSGISINDFRNVNAFQRFLETSMRRGLKAFDQIKAHFDVDVDEKILDMPEFIGGISDVVSSNKVNQTSETDGSPLGSYAGQLSQVASQKHKIKCYCDQPGYIIGILCVHPVPLYSQLLPKLFTKFDSLDNYFPEFNSIGMQPITLKEVAPIQAYSKGVSALNDVFGYQRAWYDYLSNVDEVHGLFRTQLRNFVLNRVFDDIPKLSPEFTIINPDHLNDIFSVSVVNDDEVNHKILAKVIFDVKMIRPIPKFGIPRLEPSV